jgi:death-on-curing protein
VSVPDFLTLDEVLGIHADQIRVYEGASGLRDLDLLGNHPFVDGNKRTTLMCALVFLGLSGARLRADPDDLYSLVDGVAAGEVDKAEVSVFLRRHCVAR